MDENCPDDNQPANQAQKGCGRDFLHEQTPLLHERRTLVAQSTPPPCTDTAENGVSRNIVIRLIPYIGLAMLVEAGSTLYRIPMFQILEDIICEQFNPSLGFSKGQDCSNDKAVQSELALIRGYQSTMSLLPGLLMAVPLGLVADRYDRKPVMTLSILGMTLSEASRLVVFCWPHVFRVQLVWITPLFQIIGGGPSVLNALVFASVSDASPEVYRSTMFSYIVGASIVTRLITSSIAAILMHKNAWLPVWVGFASSVLATSLSLLMPAQHRDVESPSSHGHENSPGLDATGTDGTSPKASLSPSRMVQSCLHHLKTITVFIAYDGNKDMVCAMLTLLTTTLGWHAQDILVQFARTRYGWSWSATGYLLSLESLITVVLLSAVLPLASSVLSEILRVQTQRKDLLLARYSCLLMVLGSLITGLSTSSSMMVAGHVLEFLGGAYNVVLRGLITSLAGGAHAGVVFSAVGMLETIGSLIAGPLLAVSFRIGISLGGVWVGLPFILAAGLFSMALVMLYSVNV